MAGEGKDIELPGEETSQENESSSGAGLKQSTEVEEIQTQKSSPGVVEDKTSSVETHESTGMEETQTPGAVEDKTSLKSHDSAVLSNDEVNNAEETQPQAGGSKAGETEPNVRRSTEVDGEASSEGIGGGASNEEAGGASSEEAGEAGENRAGDVQPPDKEAGEPEKLADDVILPPLWRRVLYYLFPKLQRIEEQRKIRANDPLYNASFKYAKNPIYTSKYNVITFIPKNLFEQFLRVANLYFLVLLIIQLVPGLSSVGFYTTLFPLAVVLGVTMIKDLYDDIQRHVSDYKVNHRVAQVLGPDGRPTPLIWEKVKVGDIIRLEKNDFITADLLLLSSSEPNSVIYVETAELDGETNLKVRQPLPETAGFGKDPDKLSTFKGEIFCEPPNNRLHKFRGRLDWNEKSYSLDNDKIALRGCRLRNTDWMYGMVIYAGHDTKLVQNSGKTKFKRTHLDHFMNRAVLFILAFMVVVVSICLLGSLIFEFTYGRGFLVFVPYSGRNEDNPLELGFLQILSNLIVLSNFIPISLYVTVEIIRLGLSIFINLDLKMYYPPEDVPAVARTTALNEELGQIEYIFSDKTGTLTQNVMTFLKCSIQGVRYGDISPNPTEEVNVATGEVMEGEDKLEDKEKVEPVDFSSWNRYADKDFVYYDSDFVEKSRSGKQDIAEFWKLLALCHTVLPSKDSVEDKLEYNAQSPDEAALVSAAKNFGYVFKKRDPFTTTIHNLSTGNEEKYDVLNILDFNNERKRMSVIVKYEDKITLYCKGADSIVLARLKKGDEELEKTTLQHLGEYAREGLRTLVLAKKELTPEEYAAWAEEYHAASLLQKDRDQQVDDVYSKIEQDLTLLGATAIEDKLQDGVPETIANLAKADIKIWVLTGDKQETAINIGYSCHLLTEDMKVFIVDEDTREGVAAQMREADDAIKRVLDARDGRGARVESDDMLPLEEHVGLDSESSLKDPSGPPFGIVVNGHSLRYALRPEMKLEFLEMASKCNAVICCRVTPLQKKKVVDLVKKNKKAVTLAIGDGANDVGMIKAAHIGIGISGREGQQAVLSSDYSFGQFRFLERLLLVHGRWSYHRMTTFLRYFFYKNFAFTFTQFIFAFFCGFTAQTLYDSTYIAVYNVIYTSIPVMVLGILDQDVDENNCYRYPKLYIAGQKNQEFNSIIFIRSLLKGIYVGFIVFFVLFGIAAFNIFGSGGNAWDYQSFGVAASGSLTIIVNLQIALDTSYWNPIMHVFVWLSILSWFVVIPITSTSAFYSSFFQYGGVANVVLANPNFWFYLPLSAIIALFPTMMFRLFQVYQNPSYVDLVRLKQKSEGKKLFSRIKFSRKATRKGIQKPRSGYAFSHMPGFGHLITSGLLFGKNTEEINKEQLRRRSVIGTPRPDEDEVEPKPSTTTVYKDEVEPKPSTTTVYEDAESPDKSTTVTVEVMEAAVEPFTLTPEESNVETVSESGQQEELSKSLLQEESLN